MVYMQGGDRVSYSPSKIRDQSTDAVRADVFRFEF